MHPQNYESPLRDLARQLRSVAKDHVSYSQVTDFIGHMDSHLNALAFCEETNKKTVK